MLHMVLLRSFLSFLLRKGVLARLSMGYDEFNKVFIKQMLSGSCFHV
ncbi:hypothetical protein THOG11_120078 [Vibrio harveyi]|nr:hypothetical protein TH15OA1_410080 [Vibrio harveyi]CAH1543774.1 hypothetical protein VHARVF571_560079 [Vibrio harveyi]CAH1548265.1 hypothetical protein THOD03_110078 [Vibrio harveyi]CAH1552523.1 hypothetical protein THOG11_120078 [Vibrio harveyi]CAK6715659.1 hypothetical protein HORM4_660154 [Vibrio harveyi]